MGPQALLDTGHHLGHRIGVGDVCGRRDAVLPRHVQKDEETSLTWTLKDQLIARGRVPHGVASLANGLLMEVPHFVMERKMLLGIKERAERAHTAAQRRAAQAAPGREAVHA